MRGQEGGGGQEACIVHLQEWNCATLSCSAASLCHSLSRGGPAYSAVKSADRSATARAVNKVQAPTQLTPMGV